MGIAWGRAVGWVAYVGFLGAVGAGASLYGWAKRLAPKTTDAAIRQVVAPPPVRSVYRADALNVLLLGCDDTYLPDGTLAEGSSRSDMMMLVRLDFAKGRVGGVSIPRDTVMRLPGQPHHRINAYHALGGPDLSRKAVQHLTKVKVDRVATLDSWQFMEVVNRMGGVTVLSPKKLEYTDRAGGLYIRVAEGENRMNGYQALGFVRFRHDDDDLARQARQRAFLMALRERAKADPGAALQAVDHMVPLFRGTFTQDELLSLMRWGVSLGPDKVHMTGWPVRPIPRAPTLVTDRSRTVAVLDSAGIEPALGDPADPDPDEGAVEEFAGPLPEPVEPNRIVGADPSGGHRSQPPGVRPKTSPQAKRP